MKKNLILCLGTISMIFCLINPAESGEWRHPLGLSYVSGFGYFMDVMENNKEVQGYEVESSQLPIEITYNPYYQLDNGLGFGIGIGPVQFITIDYASNIDHIELFSLPISADVRYNFLKNSNISPFARASLAYNIVSGDYVDSSKPGFSGGIGIEFFQHSIVGFGFEVSYNTSEVEMEKYSGNEWSYRLDGTEKISPEVMVSLFVIF